MKQALISAFLGKTQDRFSEYHQPTDLAGRIAIARRLRGVSGLEVVFPYETGEAEATRAAMAAAGLEFAAINANIKKDARWVPGALSRPGGADREAAVDLIRRAKDFAAAVGAPHVTCCPLSDGYDNLFQVDYPKAWRRLVDSIAAAGAYRPEIPLFLEYKRCETRVHCHLDNCARTLLAIRDAALPAGALGVTIDFGHALIAPENPAQSVALCAEGGVPYYLHTNDNDGEFDWDLTTGSRHVVHYAEFLFYAREFGYDRHFTTDASPRIFALEGFFQEHLDFNASLWELVGRLDRAKWRRLMEEEKWIDLLALVRTELMRL
jgi:xylose isomerase